MQYRHSTFLLFIIFVGTGILTVAVFQRRAALEEVQELSARAIQQAQWEEAQLPALSLNQYRSASIDVNADGIMETITLTVVDAGDDAMVTRTLRVNDAVVTLEGQNPQSYFGIVDVNTTDGSKEIVLSDEGPSSDPVTEFYRFDGSKLIKIGTTEGLYEEMTFDGAGTLTTRTRATMLDTWFFEEQFTIDFTGILVRVQKDFYERLGDATVLTALAPVGFETSPTSPVPAFSIVAGETVTIIGCDNISWCKVRNTAGVEGWFDIQAIAWADVLTGWSFAD